ncbi:MAG: glutaredoxin domain-containing protein [Geobacteraceae bacterium]|nr:glutaredoxin domain-containing protein [Geobacteraceae bacterium]
MRTTLKCLALAALFLAVLACSTTKGSEKVPGTSSAAKAPTAAYPKIVLYTVSWCSHCKEAKEYLSSRNIPYTNRDVEESDSAKEIFREKYQATTVPLIVIGNDEAIIKGFSRETFEKTLRDLKK